jgi:hypothetical protein
MPPAVASMMHLGTRLTRRPRTPVVLRCMHTHRQVYQRASEGRLARRQAASLNQCGSAERNDAQTDTTAAGSVPPRVVTPHLTCE